MSTNDTMIRVLVETETGEGDVQFTDAFNALPAITRADALKDIRAEIELAYANALCDLTSGNRKTSDRVQ